MELLQKNKKDLIKDVESKRGEDGPTVEPEVIDVYKSKSGKLYSDRLSRDVWERYEEKKNPESAHRDSAKWTTSNVKINPKYMSALPQERMYDSKSKNYDPEKILRKTRKNRGGKRRKKTRRRKGRRKKTRRRKKRKKTRKKTKKYKRKRK